MLHAKYWEHYLLDLANTALDSGATSHPDLADDRAEIEAAYRQCEDITQQHSKTFYLASSLIAGFETPGDPGVVCFLSPE